MGLCRNIQRNTMSYWFYSHLQLKHHPSPLDRCSALHLVQSLGLPQPSPPPVLLATWESCHTLLCSEPSTGSHSRSCLICPFLLSLTFTHSFSASPTRLHFDISPTQSFSASGPLHLVTSTWNAFPEDCFHLCLQRSPSLWGLPPPPSLRFHSPRPTDLSPSLFRFF